MRIFAPSGVTVRAADHRDKQRLADLTYFETRVHRHLDWRPPLEWLGYRPFLIIERGDKLLAALACPPDPASVAWIRLFAIDTHFDPLEAWRTLWPRVQDELATLGNIPAAAIVLHEWFRRILQASDFRLVNQVILLEWSKNTIPTGQPASPCLIRPLEMEDLAEIEALDRLAFGPIWHNSRESLAFAMRQAAVATVAECNGRIAAYQISTPTQIGGHLARLATHPDFQRQGIASFLLSNLLAEFSLRGAVKVTVNTQEDNLVSVRLYERAGFRRTGEVYPVYLHAIR